jgi:hypothetical protein
MSEEEHHNNSSNYINGKIVISAILSVLLGAAFILALINFGMMTQQNIDEKNRKEQEKEKISSIISVDYDAKGFDYSFKRAKNTTTQENRFFDSLNVGSGENVQYDIIDSQDKLATVMEALRTLSGDSSLKYEVNDDFFLSGSIIVTNAETEKLSDFSVKAVVRDELYNIQIDTELANEKASESTDEEQTIYGRTLFIKVQNIQPKSVKINREKKAEE